MAKLCPCVLAEHGTTGKQSACKQLLVCNSSSRHQLLFIAVHEGELNRRLHLYEPHPHVNMSLIHM